MNQRALGTSGLIVSEVGLGCEHLQGMSAKEIDAVIGAAIDHGINIADTFMSEPNVRTNIGAALKGRRDKMQMQGHIGSVWVDGQYARSRDMAIIPGFFEDWLQRMQTDYCDIGMVHFVDTEADYQAVLQNGLFDYARELKRKGVIRAVGVSSHDPVIARKLVEAGLIDVLMFSINPAFDVLPAETDIDGLFNPESFKRQQRFAAAPERTALYAACEARGVGITVMKTYAGGALLHQASSPFGVAMSAPQLIHYALTRPAVASVLIGCRTPAEVEAAVAYESASAQERDYASALASADKFEARGRCMYCNHCLPCPQVIDIAQVNKYLDLFEQSGGAPSVRAHYEALSAHAGDCIGCRQCESRCPFGVPVVERMVKATEAFGL